MDDLDGLSDDDLAAAIRDREVAYRDALAELAKRKDWYGCDQWTDNAAMIQLSAKHRRQDCPRRPAGTAPTMFRAGYEWAALSIFSILESILDKPSEDAVELCESVPAGRGLYKLGNVAKVFDPRRRAALDLIEMLEGFVSIDLKGFFALPVRRSAYNPADDAHQRWTRVRMGQSAAPLRT